MIEIDQASIDQILQDLEETEKAVKQLVKDFQKPGQTGRGILKSFKQRGFERELIDILTVLVVDNYEKAINAVPTSPGEDWKPGNISWPAMKRRLQNTPAGQPTIDELTHFGFNPELLKRNSGDAKVTSSRDWQATGFTEKKTKSARTYMNYTDVMIEIGKLADYEGETYPVDIDRRMRRTTGGNVGLMKFFVGDRNKILEKLQSQFITITDALFLNRLKTVRNMEVMKGE